MLGKFAVKASQYGENARGVFFRRNMTDLRDVIQRSKQIYGKVGAKYAKQEKEWTFPNGSTLKFAYLDNDDDADNYQGWNLTDIFFEEIEHWPSPAPVNKLRATLRSGAGVPCQFHATGNPGGVGAGWVRDRYIDPAPQGFEVIWENFKNPFTGIVVRRSRIFIPSALKDNPHLGADYVATLQQAGSEALVRAWLEGDWSAIEGAFFMEFSMTRHVLRPVALPDWWLRFRSADWGSARPFCVHWWAVAGEDWLHPDGRLVPRGALICYREWYGASAPNVGIKLTVEAVAKGIRDREKSDLGISNAASVIDPATWNCDGGPSIAERLENGGVFFRPADNTRSGRHGALGGWDMVRHRLIGDGDGNPMMVFFSTCKDIIRTLPVLQHDKDKPEDVDTDGEDHAADSVRYAALSRPWARAKPPTVEDALARAIKPLTYDDMHKLRERRLGR
jgi:hypothetical protein